MMYVIDESSWSFVDSNSLATLSHIRENLDLIENVMASEEECLYDSHLFLTEVLPGYTIYDLYVESAPIYIPHDLQERLATAFGRMSAWEDTGVLPDDYDVKINESATVFAPSLAWVHKMAQGDERDRYCCISYRPIRPTGRYSIAVSEVSIRVYFINSAIDIRHMHRWRIIEYASDVHYLEQNAPLAFENLDFTGSCFNGIKNMTKTFMEILPQILHHLAIINDYGQDIFSRPWQHAPAALGALGINASDENGKTKQNSVAEKERTIKYKDVERKFWWHSKFELHQDRMHFCPSLVPGGGRIIIGIFCEHLTI